MLKKRANKTEKACLLQVRKMRKSKKSFWLMKKKLMKKDGKRIKLADYIAALTKH